MITTAIRRRVPHCAVNVQDIAPAEWRNDELNCGPEDFVLRVRGELGRRAVCAVTGRSGGGGVGCCRPLARRMPALPSNPAPRGARRAGIHRTRCMGPTTDT